MDTRKQQGSALVVSIGLLMLLFFLAMLFIFKTRKEEQIAQSHQLQKRAQFLAQSGVEKALSQNYRKIATGVDPLYRGEDWNGDGRISNLKNGKSEDQNGNGNERLDRLHTSVKNALSPSFFLDRNQDRKPDLISIRTGSSRNVRGISGALPATFQNGSDHYSLRVIDNSTRLNIHSENPRMKELINQLYQQKKSMLNQGPSKPETPPGDKIFKKRNNIQSLNKLKELLSDEMYRFLYPHLIIGEHTWTDHTQIQPAPQSLKKISFPEKTGSAGALTYNFDYSSQPRAPVNVNRAPRYVLAALIEGLAARGIQIPRTAPPGNAPLYSSFKIGPVDARAARRIAKLIDQYRKGDLTIQFRDQRSTGPFETWPEFEAFVRQKIVSNSKLQSRMKTNDPRAFGQLLIANFSPNARLSKWNRNNAGQWSWTFEGKSSGAVRRYLDKSDLTSHSTEFTLFSTGYFEVHSYARILNNERRIEASAFVKSTIRPFRVARHSTQQDFLRNQTSSSEDQSVLYPEPVPSRSAGPGEHPLRQNIMKGTIGSSRTSGAISVAPRTYGTPPSGDHWSFESRGSSSDQSLHFYRSMDSSLPYGFRAKDFFATAEPHKGTTEGSARSSASKQYPDQKDPRHFADVLPDGLLLSSDRSRFFRVRPDTLSSLSKFWWLDGGAVSLWWKPKIDLPPGSGRTVELFESWFITNRLNVRIPIWMETYLDQSNRVIATAGKWDDAKKSIRTKFIDTALPSYFKEHFPEGALNLADAAGYNIRLYYQTGSRSDNRSAGYFMEIEFSLFSDTDEHVWENPPPGENRNVQDLVPARVLIHLPLTNSNRSEITPRGGNWTHINLHWKPEEFTLRYPHDQGNIEDGVETQKQTVRIMNGQFQVNGTPSNPVRSSNIHANQATTSHIPGTSTRNIKPYLKPHNLILTGHIYQDSDDPTKLRHNTEYEPGQIFIQNRKRISSLRNMIWFGGSRSSPGGGTGPMQFAEGTIDEVLLSSQVDPNLDGFHPEETSRYRMNTDGPVYQGLFQGPGKPPKTESTIPAPASEAYTRSTSLSDNRVKVLLLAHTQYRPRSYRGHSLKESERPYFQVSFRKGRTGKRTRTPSSCDEDLQTPWLGAPVCPGALPSAPIELSSKNLSYQLNPERIYSVSQNATPFLEDVTVLYKIPSERQVVSQTYLTAEETRSEGGSPTKQKPDGQSGSSKNQDDQPSTPGAQDPSEPESEGKPKLLKGVTIQPVNPQLRDQLKLSSDVRGLVVSNVNSETPADSAGLKNEDVITEINGRDVRTIEDVHQAITDGDENRAVLKIRREGDTKTITISR